MNVNKAIQDAIAEGRYHEARRNGKLTYYKPSSGQTVVYEDGEVGFVLKDPNSLLDFTVKISTTGETRRENVKGDTIKGYITPSKKSLKLPSA